eukprot:TRINITY_DN3356_c0_g1_i2.p1 TRINITY_DN3356_c0_g1~~TRINITY_DN3356_c0_g1_i2.p1  ORF type:complete len:309 (-),score=138.76 TRINITY_DN3356_c0_g1_i2:39-965(-)
MPKKQIGAEKAARMEKRVKSQVKRQFKKFDKDGNGYLEGKEIKEFLKALNVGSSSAERRAFFKLVDKNGDKRISLLEFDAAIKKASSKKATKEDEVREAFEAFDKDGNGTLDARELKAVIKHFAEKTTIRSRKTIFANFDVNKDGAIDFKEFRRMILAFEEEAKARKFAARLFKVFDKDKSGKIENKEFHAMLEYLSLATSGEQRLAMRKRVGDEKGHFDKDAFIKVYLASADAAKKREKQVRKVFKAADKDKSGELSRKEISSILPKIGIEIDSAELKKRLKAADADGDGELDFVEFKELLYHLQKS